jgi:CRP-like cAMP-binding protein
MGQTGLFGGQPISAADIRKTDTSVYRGSSYILRQSRWLPFKKTDFRLEEARAIMEQYARRVQDYYQKKGEIVMRGGGGISEYQRLPLYRESRDFLSLVHKSPDESGRRGRIEIQVNAVNAEPNVDTDVKELLKALGAKLK